MISGLIGSVWKLDRIETLDKPISVELKSPPFAGGLFNWHFSVIFEDTITDEGRGRVPIGWTLSSDGFWAMQRWVDNPYSYAFVELNINLNDLKTVICGYVLLPPVDVEEAVLTYKPLKFQTIGIPFYIEK